MVDIVCVYAHPEKTCTVALIIPMEAKLMEFRDQLGLSNMLSKEDICGNEALVNVILESVKAMAKKELEWFEVPQQIKVYYLRNNILLFIEIKINERFL